ncbi:MAG: O-antigen ligase family protein [Chloroflexi bacterium]|nr:O-antigen ligase family protein [Chloroflexota bacterium]
MQLRLEAPRGIEPSWSRQSRFAGAAARVWPVWRTRFAIAAGATAALATGWYTAARSPVLTGGAVVGTILGVWALRNAEVALWALVALIALLPFGIVPLRLGVAPTLLDVATAAIFFLWFARGATGRTGTRLTPIGGWLVLFSGVLAVAYLLSGDALHTGETARLFGRVVAAHLLFVPLLNLVATYARTRRLLRWFTAVAALEAVIGTLLYAIPRDLAYRALASLGPLGYPTGDSVLRYRPETSVLRANGTAVDPNMLGALLMVASAIAVAQVLASRPAMPRVLAGAALAPLALCLVLTDSRGSWLGLASGLLLLGALRYRRLWITFALVAALAFVLPQAQRYTSHLSAGLQARDRASVMRLGELRNAAEVIARYPWFGAGWGSTGRSIELEFTLGVSNVFLTVAERSGLPALGVYLVALLALASRLTGPIRARLRDPHDDGLLLGCAAALVGTLVAGQFDHHFVRFPHLVSLLWLLAALAVVLTTERREAGGKRQVEAPPSPRRRVAVSPRPSVPLASCLLPHP